MDTTNRTALDAETPVNPYSLLDALNTAAARTNAVWLLFLGLLAYVALAVGALTHRDLLLDAGIALPLLQTRIDLGRFFVGAPAVLALAHLALIAQFTLLARKAVEFNGAVRLLESTDLRSHPLRLELDSFFFAQAIAGPERSRVVGAILYGLGWLTLLLLPLALLVYLQIAFLPFHNATVSAMQRGIVLADIAVVLLAGVFLLRAETSFFRAALRLGISNPGSVAFGLATLAGAAFVAVAATVPGATGRQRAAVRPLSPQSRPGRREPRRRQGSGVRRHRRPHRQSARTRPALRQARPRRPAPGRPDGRPARRRQPHRCGPARRQARLRQGRLHVGQSRGFHRRATGRRQPVRRRSAWLRASTRRRWSARISAGRSWPAPPSSAPSCSAPTCRALCCTPQASCRRACKAPCSAVPSWRWRTCRAPDCRAQDLPART